MAKRPRRHQIPLRGGFAMVHNIVQNMLRNTYPVFRRNLVIAALLLLALSLSLSLTTNLASAACGQFYTAKTLVKNTGTKADKQLINPWGLVYGPSAPFWLSDEGSGLSTLYTGAGAKQSTVVTVPPASGTGLGSPTGIVYNGLSEFQIDSWPSEFIFCT